MADQKNSDEKDLAAGLAGAAAGTSAAAAAVATATPAVTLMSGIPALGVAPVVIAATGPVIAPALAAGAAAAAAAYLVKKLFK